MHVLIFTIFGLGLDIFFQRRSLPGASVPLSGPIIVVANHPNGLMDPVVVTRISQRPLRFLAKEPLFRMPVLGALIRAVYALPIYRSKDGHNTAGNRGTFDAVEAALADGDAICVFPEGISHDESELQPLKTGAARMALGAEAKNDFSLGIQIVPVGLMYTDKHSFRGRVASLIGAPISVAEFKAAHAEDPRNAARALTAAIDTSLRNVTLNLTDWADLPLIELCAQIWAEPEDDPATLKRLLADGERHFRGRAEAFRERLQAFAQQLDAVGLRADTLDTQYRSGSVARFLGRVSLALVFGLPAALLGAVAYFVLYQATRLVAAKMPSEPDTLSSVKYLTAMLFFPIWQLVLTVMAGVFLGKWGVLCSLLLPIAGLYTHRFLERRGADFAAARLFFRVLFKAGDRGALIAERAALRNEIARLAAQYQTEVS